MTVDIQDRVLPSDGSEWALVFLHVEYADGSPENYLLPVARAEGEAAEAVRAEAAGAILTELTDGGKKPAILYEAVYNAGFRTQMMKMIATGGAWPGLAGVLRGHPKNDAFKDHMPDAADESKVLKAEQSNTSIIFPGRHFVKFLRRLEEGENPELEILRFFDESTSFRNVPPYVGSVEYSTGANATYSIAIAEGLVPHEQDAWSYALQLAGEYTARVLESRATLGPLPPMSGGFRTRPRPEEGAKSPASAHATPIGMLEDGLAIEFARLLGTRTAEMHLALASRPDLPAFAPEPFSRLYQRSLYQSMRNQVARVYERLSKAMPRLPEPTAELGRKILDGRPKVMGAFGGLLERLIPTVKTRIHGDYHLGQVLYTGKDVVILDFEGEPARSLSERKLKRSPWKDVAGMIRSFHYAIHSAWPRALVLREEERRALDPWIELWPDRMTAGFLEAYLKTAGNAAFVPVEKDWEALLRAHLMEKAVYELGYELNNRPDWAHIPMAGILRLI
jgi:maltose alpha-D-glucosyltransferase / alpha-amylase